MGETNGRLLGTRTPDLYRVKGQLTNTTKFQRSESGTEFPGRCSVLSVTHSFRY